MISKHFVLFISKIKAHHQIIRSAKQQYNQQLLVGTRNAITLNVETRHAEKVLLGHIIDNGVTDYNEIKDWASSPFGTYVLFTLYRFYSRIVRIGLLFSFFMRIENSTSTLRKRYRVNGV